MAAADQRYFCQKPKAKKQELALTPVRGRGVAVIATQ